MAFSADNRQIIFANKGSGQGNTLAKYTIIDKGYSDGVSCVRFSLNTAHYSELQMGQVWYNISAYYNN